MRTAIARPASSHLARSRVSLDAPRACARLQNSLPQWLARPARSPWLVHPARGFADSASPTSTNKPIIRIEGATFYRRQPGHYEAIEREGAAAKPADAQDDAQEATTSKPNDNPPLFPNLSLSLPSEDSQSAPFAIIGPSNAGKTTLLEILRGRHLCFPPTARSFPYLSTPEIRAKDPRLQHPSRAIVHVGFNTSERGLSGLGAGTHMASRYEAHREATDFSVADFLRGRTQLNAVEADDGPSDADVARVVKDLKLEALLDMPVSNLSNGQTRRARIARALLTRPEVLLLDEPFMGLDPHATVELSNLLRQMAAARDPRIVLALRPQDPVPDWVRYVYVLGEDGRVTRHGPTEEVREALEAEYADITTVWPPTGPRVPEELRLHSGYEKKTVLEMARRKVDREEAASARARTAVQAEGVQGAEAVQDAEGVQDEAWPVAKSPTEHRTTFRLGPRLGKQGIIQVMRKVPKNPAKTGAERIPTRTLKLGPEPPLGFEVVTMDGVVVKYGDKTVLGAGPTRCVVRRRHPETGKVVPGEMLEKVGQTDGLYWRVYAGQRWVVMGPNGSGKTTLLALLTSDHPQSYSQPIRLFGRPRLPIPGKPAIPLSALQRRIGHSSPEVHAFFPRHLTVRRVLESAFSHAPLVPPSTLDASVDERISAFLRWFQQELNPPLGPNKYVSAAQYGAFATAKWDTNSEEYRATHNAFWYEFYVKQTESVEWADTTPFSALSMSAQRVLLFLRAIVAKPSLVVLDEALSGLDARTRDKCLLFLLVGEVMELADGTEPFFTRRKVHGLVASKRGKRDIEDARFSGLNNSQALVVVSHVREEVPGDVRDWLFLDAKGSPRLGKVDEVPLACDEALWDRIWAGRMKLPQGQSPEQAELRKARGEEATAKAEARAKARAEREKAKAEARAKALEEGGGVFRRRRRKNVQDQTLEESTPASATIAKAETKPKVEAKANGQAKAKAKAKTEAGGEVKRRTWKKAQEQQLEEPTPESPAGSASPASPASPTNE